MKNLALVLLLAVLIALICERYVASLGATRLAAAGTAGAAFLGSGTFGVMVLEYLTSTASS